MTKTLHYRNCQVQVCADLPHLSTAAAQQCVRQISAAIEARGVCHLALAGGSTPKALYALLAEPAYAQQIAWDRLHVYFGDERYVPHDTPESNYNMARAVLLDKVALPVANIHPIPTAAGDARHDAQTYAVLLERNLPVHNHVPVFDLVLLGMGEDGHTASLFPDTPVLNATEQSVAAVYVEKLASWRISLTLPVLNAAQCVMFIVSGSSKASMLRRVFTDTSAQQVPIQRVRPAHACYWYLDAAAAAELTP